MNALDEESLVKDESTGWYSPELGPASFSSNSTALDAAKMDMLRSELGISPTTGCLVSSKRLRGHQMEQPTLLLPYGIACRPTSLAVWILGTPLSRRSDGQPRATVPEQTATTDFEPRGPHTPCFCCYVLFLQVDQLMHRPAFDPSSRAFGILRRFRLPSNYPTKQSSRG